MRKELLTIPSKKLLTLPRKKLVDISIVLAKAAEERSPNHSQVPALELRLGGLVVSVRLSR